jgi:hypothetical protein
MRVTLYQTMNTASRNFAIACFVFSVLGFASFGFISLHERGRYASAGQRTEATEAPPAQVAVTSPSAAAVRDALAKSAIQSDSFTVTLSADAKKLLESANQNSSATILLTNPQAAPTKPGPSKLTVTPVSPQQMTAALDQTAAAAAKGKPLSNQSAAATTAQTPAWVLWFMAVVTPSTFLLLRLGFSMLVGIVAVVLLVRGSSTAAATNWASGTLGTIVGYWMKFS